MASATPSWPGNFCHGNEDGGAEIKGIPYLAGLGSYYIGKQIDDYLSGARARHPVIQEVANELSTQQIADVVAYFAQIERVPPDPAEDVDAALVSPGERIAEIGDAERQLQACSNCYGPRGIGGLPAIPPLARQSARYITAPIEAWQKVERMNNGGSQMRNVASRMDDDAAAAVAAYFAQLGTAE